MCTMITPWGYTYLRLPIGVIYAPGIFQDKMFTSMEGLEFSHTYLYYLIFFRGVFTKCLSDVELVLVRLYNDNIKVNAVKLSFGKNKIYYLGYVVSREGINSQPKQIKAIMKIARPIKYAGS